MRLNSRPASSAGDRRDGGRIVELACAGRGPAAGAIAIPIGLLLWSDAASMTVPSISEYSGTVASVSSDPKFGTHMTIRAENGPSPDIFFDGVVLDVRVGDRAAVWAENQAGGEWGLKFQSDRETWIDPSYGDLTKPVPPRGLFSALALGGGVALVIVGLAGAYRRIAKSSVARPLPVSAGPPTDVGRAGLQAAAISGAEAASAPTSPSPTAVGRAGTIAQIALALGGVMWVAALMVRATGGLESTTRAGRRWPQLAGHRHTCNRASGCGTGMDPGRSVLLRVFVHGLIGRPLSGQAPVFTYQSVAAHPA